MTNSRMMSLGHKIRRREALPEGGIGSSPLQQQHQYASQIIRDAGGIPLE
jgi:hypothetical protein